MSERKWTAAQQAAIDYKGKNLILSAAAGSGKTATLTERIIRLLKDRESGAELSRMLIVTFTVAAAGELRSRIADALTKAIADEPESRSLARQLASLESARISTIDSFFKTELRPYFSSIGLPPEFSILDEAEAAVLKNEAMTDTVCDCFDGRGDICVSDFRLLADCLSDARSESDLSEKLLRVTDSLLSYDISSDALRAQADDLESAGDDFFSTTYADSIKAHLLRMSEHFAKRLRALAAELSEGENTQKYVEEALRLATVSEELSSVAGGTYSGARLYFSRIEFSSLSPLRREKQTDAYVAFKDIRSALKDEISDMRERFFLSDDETVARELRITAKLLRTLAQVNDHFIKTYAAAKRDRGEADFSDLAVFARRIFVSPDGTPTKAALEVGKKFDYIFIDEYQDTNPVQDAVFSAVSTLAGRFMVGDVKQSIYGFRGSCPQLFTDYRRKYEKGDGGDAIFMSENFRSDRCVIDFSNSVSRYIFKTGHTPFEAADELVCSKLSGEADSACEVILCEKETGDENTPEISEAAAVAARISKLLSEEKLSDGSPITPKDVAILLRSGVNAESYVRELSALGIPVNNSASEEFFAYGEVLLILCLLNCADNPLRDIYLAGAMKSPLFGFTLNDLVNIRKNTETPLWYSLCDFCDTEGEGELFEKCRRFRSTVDRWRRAASELYCDEVLRIIVSDTSLRTYGGDGQRKNADIVRSLKILSDHAASVAKRGGSLHELIAHLNSVIERKDRGGSFTDPDSVSILTIHKSKGLEYPVCFICEAAKKFNMRDSAEKLLMDRRGRIAMKLYDEGGIVRCDNPLRRAVALQMREDAIEEEARVLYVAMTRARERLFVSCKVKNAAERLEKASAKAAFELSAYEVLASSTYGDWIVDALKREGPRPWYTLKKAADITPTQSAGDTRRAACDPALSEFFEKTLDFSYDKEYLWNIPAKLSVSSLKPDILGGGEDRDTLDGPSVISMPDEAPVPGFLSGKKTADGAAKGTATHVFMQFCDYEHLYSEGAEAELSRLIEKRFISREDAALVRLPEIELFRESELFRRLLSAKYILRERRFNTILPAKDFTEDPDMREKLERDGITITVQGVVDCIFIDSDGRAVLVDYKTDRLTQAELSDEAEARKKLLSRHSGQLTLYSRICERMIGRPFDSVCIYSLHLGKTIEVEGKK